METQTGGRGGGRLKEKKIIQPDCMGGEKDDQFKDNSRSQRECGSAKLITSEKKGRGSIPSAYPDAPISEKSRSGKKEKGSAGLGTSQDTRYHAAADQKVSALGPIGRTVRKSSEKHVKPDPRGQS